MSTPSKKAKKKERQAQLAVLKQEADVPSRTTDGEVDRATEISKATSSPEIMPKKLSRTPIPESPNSKDRSITVRYAYALSSQPPVLEGIMKVASEDTTVSLLDIIQFLREDRASTHGLIGIRYKAGENDPFVLLKEDEPIKLGPEVKTISLLLMTEKPPEVESPSQTNAAFSQLIEQLFSSEKDTLVNGLRQINRLLEQYIAHLVAGGLVQALLRLLPHEERSVVERALAILATVCEYDVCRNTVHELEGVPLLTKLLRSPHERIACGACVLAAELCADDDKKAAVGEPLIPILLELLSNENDIVRAASAACLWNLAYRNDHNCEMIRDGNGITKLITMLEDKNEEVIEKAVGALANIAISKVCKADIIKGGAVRPLFDLMSAPSDSVQNLAAWALTYLSKDSEDISVETIVKRLGSDSAKLKLSASIDAAFLAFKGDATRVAMYEAGIVPGLVKLLKAKETEVQQYAALALVFLSNGQPKVCESLATENAIPQLVTLLDSKTEFLQEYCARLLLNMCSDNEKHREVVREAQGIEKLTNLLSSPNENVQREAAGAIWNLSYKDRVNCAAIRDAKGIPALVRLLYSTNELVQENAAGALWNLAHDPAHKPAIREAGAIPYLVNLLQSESASLRGQVCGTLAELAADNVENTEMIIASNAVPLLARLISSRSEQVRTASLAALSQLIKSDIAREQLTQSGALDTVLTLMNSGSGTVRTHAHTILNYLSQRATESVEPQTKGRSYWMLAVVLLGAAIALAAIGLVLRARNTGML